VGFVRDNKKRLANLHCSPTLLPGFAAQRSITGPAGAAIVAEDVGVASRGFLRQLIKQRLGLLEVERVEPLGKPSIDRSEQFASLLRFALRAPEAREPHRGGVPVIPPAAGERLRSLARNTPPLSPNLAPTQFHRNTIDFGFARQLAVFNLSAKSTDQASLAQKNSQPRRSAQRVGGDRPKIRICSTF
jgi:hypothetical protein